MDRNTRDGIKERMERLGNIIGRKQKAERFTNREISRLSGIPDQTIINIRQGNNFVFSKLMAICDIIGLDICLTDRITGETFRI